MKPVIQVCALVVFVVVGCKHSTPLREQRKLVSSNNTIGMQFVTLPAGTFQMGSSKSPTARPVHSVTLDAFEIGSTEVTNAQFEQFMKRTRSEESSLSNGPVTGVTRKDVLRFAAWLSKKDDYTYMLPTQAQWEYAARGGLEGKDYPWGDEIDDTKALFEGKRAVAVKTYPPNGYGLYEMCGNVREMCWGELEVDYTSEQRFNPRGPLAMDFYASRGLGICTPLQPWIWHSKIEVELPEPGLELPGPGLGFRLVRIQDKLVSKAIIDALKIAWHAISAMP
jgi:formylglycine-generating enzyme required for sulfatase activity